MHCGKNEQLLLSSKLKYYVDVKTPNNDHEQMAQCITKEKLAVKYMND